MSKIIPTEEEAQATEQNGNTIDLPIQASINEPSAQPEPQQQARKQSNAQSAVSLDEKADEPKRRFLLNDPNEECKFVSNAICTSKYTLWDFVPKNLFLQFTKMANAYFIFMGFLQLYKPISQPGAWITTFMSVVFIIGVSAVKDALEDAKRHSSDAEENNRVCKGLPFGSEKTEEMTSSDIQVGMLVKVKEDEFFPCDMYILNSSLKKGLCFIETKNLDGETNLKHKQVDKTILELAVSESNFKDKFEGASIECETPNEFLYKFEGTILADCTASSVTYFYR